MANRQNGPPRRGDIHSGTRGGNWVLMEPQIDHEAGPPSHGGTHGGRWDLDESSSDAYNIVQGTQTQPQASNRDSNDLPQVSRRQAQAQEIAIASHSTVEVENLPYLQQEHAARVPTPPQAPSRPQSQHSAQGPPDAQYYPNQGDLPIQYHIEHERAGGFEMFQANHPKAERESPYTRVTHNGSGWRWKWPHSFHHPGVSLGYDSHHHRDMMQRSKDFGVNEYYLSPRDRRLRKLLVQSTQPITDANRDSTWRRTSIRNQNPYLLQVTNWATRSLPRDGRAVQSDDLLVMGLKWLPACVAIFVLMILPTPAAGETRNGGCYDPFPYRFWGYPLNARNLRENEAAAEYHLPSSEKPSTNGAVEHRLQQPNPIIERPLEPKYLRFLTGRGGATTGTVSRWKQKHKQQPTYVFISYTGEQLRTDEDIRFLRRIGEYAARKEGASAYWVGCDCLGDRSEVEENVSYISDIVRGSKKLIIAVQHRPGSQKGSPDTDGLLREWGKRVWTLPEILLITSSSDIDVYARNGDIEHSKTINKRNFATMWADAPVARQLIDHYEGNLVLSTLELVTVALQCLHGRQTITYFPGDVANALMGLLRRRPVVTRDFSAFQAFARLSLANVNDLLLERLICILPLSLDQPWYDMADQYQASLWDIYPTTQICGIGKNDTVMLDGAHAASIRWKAFARVARNTRDSWRRTFLRYAFRSATWFLVVGVLLVQLGQGAIGAIILLIGLFLILLSPYFARVLYTGKLWATQPWFFGFEGYLDISTIEQKVFGVDMGHLKWSTNGSPLSMHASNEYGECIGKDPTSNPDTRRKVEESVNCQMGKPRIFTLVDTNTLTVTMFEAVRPPVAVVLCGEEGGMQRALLCSYEWSSQTLYRESVLRMETPVLEKFNRVGRLRLGLRRK